MTLPRLLRIVRHRLRSLSHRSDLDADLGRELAFHLDQLAGERVAGGMAMEDARHAASRALGNVGLLSDACRDERRMTWLDDVLQDVRFGCRLLGRHAGFAVMATTSLALGIGASTAVLSAAGAIFLGRLPFPNGDRVVILEAVSPPAAGTTDGHNATRAEYLEWKRRSHSFDAVGASFVGLSQGLRTDDGRPVEPIAGRSFTPDVFTALGVVPAKGRLFTDADLPPNGPAHVVVISDRLWRARFNGDAHIIGRQMRLDGTLVTIIGVLPGSFHYEYELADYWTPVRVETAAPKDPARIIHVTAHLGPGATIASAQADMDHVASDLAGESSDDRDRWSVRVVPVRDAMYGWTAPPLMMLGAVAAIVLTIACANIAGLLLVRGAARGPEIALRAAVGASPRRIVRQLLTEGVLLALAGGALGLVVARIGLWRLAATTPFPGYSRIPAIGLRPGAYVADVLLSAVVGVAFSIVPALAAARVNLSGPANGVATSRATDGRAPRLRSVLVAAQIALALVLIVEATLLTKTYTRLLARDLNFDPNGLTSVQLRIPPGRYIHRIGMYRGFDYYDIRPAPSEAIARVYDRLRAVPGAESVAGISQPVVNNISVQTVSLKLGGTGESDDESEQSLPTAAYFLVTPNFFATMGTSLVQGRECGDGDTVTAPWVTVVNETAAKRFWPGASAIGQRLTVDIVPEEQSRDVVGVVRNIPLRRNEIDPRPVIYTCYLQQPSRYRAPYGGLFGGMTFMIRHPSGAPALIPDVQRAAAEIEPNVPLAIGRLAENSEQAGPLIGNFHVLGILIGVAAAVATLLAAIGVYGVIFHTVSARAREVAIRRAMGARAGEILSLAGRRMVVTIAAGLAAGLVAHAAVSTLLAPALWGITAWDPTTLLSACLLLAGVSLAACVIPATRALASDTTAALGRE